jgi:hypothetical protein
MTRWKPRRLAVALLAALACALFLAACGDGGGSKSSNSTTTTVSRASTFDLRSAERACQKAAATAQHPGDDAGCDALAGACGDHDWRACDRLFQVSDLGSEYETIGGTCAGSTTLDERLASISQPGTQDPRIADEYCEQVIEPRIEAFLRATTTTTAGSAGTTTSAG